MRTTRIGTKAEPEGNDGHSFGAFRLIKRHTIGRGNTRLSVARVALTRPGTNTGTPVITASYEACATTSASRHMIVGMATGARGPVIVKLGVSEPRAAPKFLCKRRDQAFGSQRVGEVIGDDHGITTVACA